MDLPIAPVFEARPWINDGPQTPFILLNRAGGIRTQAQGTNTAFVGHRWMVPGDPRVRGLFAQWSWDGETLEAQTDPLGGLSLFVYSKDDQIGISPSILRLLEHGADPAIDPVALAVFHRLGFFVLDDTPFAHIKVLSPGGRLTWRQGQLTIEAVLPAPRTQHLTRAQAVEAIIEIPRASIRRFTDYWTGPIALPLSGGRDSRHILLEMLHQGSPPDTCVTFHHGGVALNAEVQAARAVASRAGVHHTVLGHPRSRVRDALRGLLMTQLCSDEHGQMMPMHDFFSNRREQGMAAIDGIAGDILTNPDDNASAFMSLALKGDYEGIARSMVADHARIISRPWHHGGAGKILSPDLEDAAIDRITQAIRIHAASPDPYQSFWFWNRTRREIAFVSTAIMGDAAMVFCPFLDPDMVDLGLSLPWSVTQDQQLHNDAIRRAFPKFADIPFSEGFHSQTIPRNPLRQITNLLDALKVSARVSPRQAVYVMKDFLGLMPLQISPSSIYRLHAEIISSVDARYAHHLLSLGSQLHSSSMKKAVVFE